MGTNTVLVSVVEASRRGVPRLVWEGSRITRLGAGVDGSGQLRGDALERTASALAELAAEAREHGAETVVGVGTSALRDATNRDAFVARARASLDRFDVIDGEREAELTFRGAFFGLEAPTGPVTVVDVGGGSTEIVRGEGGRALSRASVNVGSVRLTERHALGDEKPTRAQLAAIRTDVERATKGLVIEPPLAMLAGTATNVAAVALYLDLAHGGHPPHGVRVPAPELRTAIDRITSASRRDRAKILGIEPGREDVIVAGALIVEHVLDRSGAGDVLISDGGVRFGLALDELAREPGRGRGRRPSSAC